jgi:V/A-type H+-transporting ATPase subunit I
MGLNMSPVKMLVAKLVTRIDLERQLIVSLEEFGLFEPIDIRQQVGFIEIKKSREEESVYVILDQLTEMIGSLGLNVNRHIGQRVPVDDGELSDSVLHAREVVLAVRSEVLEIDKQITLTQQELEVALSLQLLGVNLSEIGSTDYTFTTAGTIPITSVLKLKWILKEITDNAVVISISPLRPETALMSVSVPVDKQNAVKRVLNAMGYEPFSIPEGYRPPSKVSETTADVTISQLEEELERLKQRKDSISYEWGPRLLGAWEVLDIERQRIEAKAYLAYTDDVVKVWGWIPEGTQEKLEIILRKKTMGQVVIEFEHPDFAEYDSPSYIQNPSFMKPAQDVVTSFGAPSKHDLDPTKILFFTFPLIFGLIFADVGQGFLIFLIGVAALRAKRKGDDWGDILGYIQNGAEGLIMMGAFSIFFGFLFGEFFGAQTVLEPIWPIFAHHLENGEENPYRTAHMLKLAIEVGALHILLGILLNLIGNLKHHNFRGVIVALSYIWMYLGFVNLLFGISYTNISAWFSSTGSVNLWIPIAGIGYGIGNNGIYPTIPISPLIFSIIAFIVPFIVMGVTSMINGMEGAALFMEYGIGTISHTVSYARIFALNIVHIILSSVFISLPAIIEIPFPHVEIFGVELIPEYVWHEEQLVTPYLPLLGAIVGTMIVGVLEGLLAFMHTLRLHYVEWFSKFMHGGGIPFIPYHIKRIHTISTSKLPNIPAEHVSYELTEQDSP